MTHALLTADDFVSTPIEEGDAGIVLKPDGSFKVFSTGAIDGANLTPEQQAQGEKLVALAVALKTPAILDVLINMSRDPRVVGSVVDLGRMN